MADLPDWFSAFQGLSVEATSFTYGLDANKAAVPAVSQIYLATDTKILYVCVSVGVWTGFDVAILTQGVLAIARGGTGLSTIAAGGILYAAVLDTLSRIAPTAANQVLRSTAANVLEIAALVAADIPDLDVAKITTGRFGLARMPAGTSTYVLTGQGAGSDPAYASLPAYAVIGSGNYVGDSTANRAIAHGLGVTPKFVLIITGTSVDWVALFTSTMYWIEVATPAVGTYAVTTMTSTNFYVGNAGAYNRSANFTGSIYYWVALG